MFTDNNPSHYPATPFTDVVLAYEGTGEDPYPEFEDECFELYFELGMKACDFQGEAALNYVKWLEKNAKGLLSEAPVTDVVTPPFQSPKIE